MTIWHILRSFGTFFQFFLMHKEKSGNPGFQQLTFFGGIRFPAEWVTSFRGLLF
jgi:hypothetical protein